MIGMSSLTGYTRLHWTHRRPAPFFTTSTLALSTGQTRISRRSGCMAMAPSVLHARARRLRVLARVGPDGGIAKTERLQGEEVGDGRLRVLEDDLRSLEPHGVIAREHVAPMGGDVAIVHGLRLVGAAERQRLSAL